MPMSTVEQHDEEHRSRLQLEREHDRRVRLKKRRDELALQYIAIMLANVPIAVAVKPHQMVLDARDLADMALQVLEL